MKELLAIHSESEENSDSESDSDYDEQEREPAKSVRCNFFKYSNSSNILPDMDCNLKIYNHQEMMEHVTKEHHKIDLETAQNLVHELWE